MKSRNIFERDSVKNIFEAEQKKQEKNSVLSVLSGLALFFVATYLPTYNVSHSIFYVDRQYVLADLEYSCFIS